MLSIEAIARRPSFFSVLMVATSTPRIHHSQRANDTSCAHKQKKKAIFVTCLAAISAASYFRVMHDRRPKRNSAITGQKRIDQLMEGHPGPFKEQYGMNKHVFNALLQFLCTRCQLQNSRYISAAEQLSIFCHFAAQGLSNRQLQDLFQHSGETITKYVFWNYI